MAERLPSQLISLAPSLSLSPKRMWQRFSSQARKAIFNAQEEAQGLGQSYLSTEHILLGLLCDEGSVACLILLRMDVSLTQLREEVMSHLAKGEDRRPVSDMTLTPRGKRIIDLAYLEARELKRNYIGTEHILLGLLSEQGGIAGRVLREMGVSLDRVREEAATFDLSQPEKPPEVLPTPPRNQPMWQRFTERARKVVFYAQEEAQKFGEGYVSTEHMLLGLCREGNSIAARVLEAMGISLNRIRIETEKQLSRGDARPSQDMTLTPRCKRVIDLAYDEARNLNNNYIGTEHLLLGLIREGDGLAGRVLAKLGTDLERARREVIAIQDQEGRPATTPPEPPKTTRAYAWSSYDESAQRALVLADEMAKSQGERQVWPYHLISALLAEPESRAARLLRQAGLDPNAVMEEIERHRSWAEGAPPIHLSPNSRLAIDSTYEEANSLDAENIGTEHLLLGLAFGNVNGLGRILSDMGVRPGKLRQALLEMNKGPSDPDA